MQPQTRNNGAIAQLVEQRTENPCVPGSIPGGTTFKKEKRCKSLNFKEVRGFFISRIGKISGTGANYTSLFKGLFLKAQNVPLRGIYFILLQLVALFYTTGFSVRFPNFVSLKIEPYGKKKIQRVVLHQA